MHGSNLTKALRNARARTLAIFEDLEGQQLLGPDQHHVEPPIWELGHVAWFQELWLSRHLDAAAPLMAGGDAIYDAFNVSYKLRTKHDYPGKPETLAYAGKILDTAIARLGSVPVARQMPTTVAGSRSSPYASAATLAGSSWRRSAR